MNKKMDEKIRIIADGRERFERTTEFERKVTEIKKEVKDKYSLILLEERSWIKRLVIRIKLNVEIRRKIAELSSDKNLHVICNYEGR